MKQKIYKRLALCEVTEDEHGTIINIKVEVPPPFYWLTFFSRDEGLERRLYTKLATLRERENFADYHVFTEILIREYINCIELLP